MLMSSRIVAIVSALTLASFGSTVDAEPIAVTITSGSASLNIEGGRIALTGTDGFSLTGSLDNSAIPSWYCCATTPPGTSTTFQASFSGSDVPSVVTFQGETFGNVGAPLSPGSASVNFVSSPFTLPPLTDDNIVITAPFTFAGTFVESRDPGESPLELTLVGSGIGTFQLIPISSTWLGFGGTFQFTTPVEVTPEPGTLVLLGLALAGTYGARRGGGRKRSSLR
jgi:hypothetical protein